MGFYVDLHIHSKYSRATSRDLAGQMKEMAPSPFLLDIEERLLQRTRSEPEAKKPEPFKQLDVFGS